MNILALDTSIAACGAAHWKYGELRVSTIRPSKLGNLAERVGSLIDKLESFVRTETIDVVLIEMPTFQESERGKTAAVSGGLIKLAFTAGALASHYISTVEKVRLITPQMWKGCLSKEMTTKRLMRCPRFGPLLAGMKFDHNAADAAAMLKWYLDRVSKPIVLSGKREIRYL